MQVGVVTGATQAVVIGGENGMALCQELVEEAAIALGLIGAGYRRREWSAMPWVPWAQDTTGQPPAGAGPGGR